MNASALGRTFTNAEEGLVVLASVLDSSTEYSIIATDPRA